MTNKPDTPSSMAGPLSLAGLLALLVTAIDWVSAVWPFNPGELPWRYGAVGITAGFTVTAVIGTVLLAMGQLAGGRTGSVRVLGYLTGAIAVILALALVIFALDGLQMAGRDDSAAQLPRRIGVAIVSLKLIGAVLVFGGVARGLLRAARMTLVEEKRSGPIVGSGSKAG